MQHSEAQDNHTVERYLLNEMSDDEREDYEAHYFDCHLCAADVVDGERLMASGRVVASETPAVVPFPPRRSWTAWIPAAAAALLLGINGAVLSPALRTAPVAEIMTGSVEIVRVGESRGPNDPPITLRAGVTNELSVEMVLDHPYPKYEIRLRNAAGKVVAQPAVSAKMAGEGVHLLLRSLPAGSYVLTIHGVQEDGNLPVVATYEVQVR